MKTYIHPEVLTAISMEIKHNTQAHHQLHPNGTGDPALFILADHARKLVEAKDEVRELTWAEVLLEEVLEALSESDTAKLERELTQVAAVTCQWLNHLKSLQR